MQYTREERGDLSRMSENIVGANPIPLGLAGLALTVALFGTFNAGELRMGSLMTSMMMLLFGGVVTFICAVFAYRNRDTVATTLFGSLSAFWAGLGVLFFANNMGHTIAPFLSGNGFTWFWFFWAITGTCLWLATLRANFALSTFVGLMAAMFWCLWLGELTLGRPGTGWTQAAGFVGWAAAAIGGYAAFAELINSAIGKMVLPEFGPRTFQATTNGR